MDYDVRFINSMEKVLPRGGMLNAVTINRLTGFQGQRVSFQMAYCFHGDYYLNQTLAQAFRNPYVTVKVEGDFPGTVSIRKIGCVPVMFPHEKQYKKFDSEYIGDEPGLYPDVLEELEEGIQIVFEQWRSLWIDCEIPEDAKGNDYRVEIVLLDVDGQEVLRKGMTVHVIEAKLPKQRLIHTEWFYPDCLADYYEVESFSEKHWQIIEAFMAKAVSRGVNMILTPLFTPALDTLIGRERTTTQLVEVTVENGTYRFGFERFRHWVEVCKRCGVEYYEMAHLFSQWGAKFPPKVVATVDGKEQRIFGWDTDMSDGRYQEFLAQMLPLLRDEIMAAGIEDKTFFHVSDEPTKYNADTYNQALEMVRPYIGEMPIIDALSHVELYQEGVVKKPVPSSEYVHEFLDAGMTHGWTYYCCGQGCKVSNRFIAMPGWRTRILGVQLYKYQMEGFLHWGYNFYNSQYSLHKIDPYRVNDAEDAFPSGDPFVVYPGKDGNPVESMRLPLLEDAMLDVRILEYLESLTSREHVLEVLKEKAEMDIRFDEAPVGVQFLLDLWNVVAEEIEDILKSR